MWVHAYIKVDVNFWGPDHVIELRFLFITPVLPEMIIWQIQRAEKRWPRILMNVDCHPTDTWIGILLEVHRPSYQPVSSWQPEVLCYWWRRMLWNLKWYESLRCDGTADLSQHLSGDLPCSSDESECFCSLVTSIVNCSRGKSLHKISCW